MTEQESVDQFVEQTFKKFRHKGLNAAVTNVIYQAIRAAANMAVRDKQGLLDTDNAEEILDDAVRVMGRCFG